MWLDEFRKKVGIYHAIVKSEKKYLSMKMNNENSEVAELIRLTHSMEKGLCISNVRLGFGHEKQKQMLILLDKLRKSDSKQAKEASKMAIASLDRYLNFHFENDYSDDTIDTIEEYLKEVRSETTFGGTIIVTKEDLKFDTVAIEKFFESRHSVRDFAAEDIEDIQISKALSLAQKSPSACNRQAYRVHILSKELSARYANKLAGIGGFAEQVNRFVLVTGKTSSYREEEINQYIVSASMYAAYLTLSLHLYGIGSCVVQRPLIWDEEWDSVRKKFNIPCDEQLICLLAIGKYKDKTEVPKSYRFSEDIMFDYIR